MSSISTMTLLRLCTNPICQQRGLISRNGELYSTVSYLPITCILMHNTSTEYKKIHYKTILWNDNWILIFICFMGILLLESSASSYSSFMIASFLIQMLRWIISSSRDQIFIFLIAWGIFFRWWDLDLQLLPSSLLFLWVELLLLLRVYWK